MPATSKQQAAKEPDATYQCVYTDLIHASWLNEEQYAQAAEDLWETLRKEERMYRTYIETGRRHTPYERTKYKTELSRISVHVGRLVEDPKWAGVLSCEGIPFHLLPLDAQYKIAEAYYTTKQFRDEWRDKGLGDIRVRRELKKLIPFVYDYIERNSDRLNNDRIRYAEWNMAVEDIKLILDKAPVLSRKSFIEAYIRGVPIEDLLIEEE